LPRFALTAAFLGSEMPGVHGHFSRPAPLATSGRDGYAEFYGYGVTDQPAKARDSDDAFARFFGYSTADEVVPKMGLAHLPDRDPMSPTRSDPTQSMRSCKDATETSLQMVRSTIRDRKMQLRVAEGEAAEALRREIEQLRKQKRRLHEAAATIGAEIESGRGWSGRLCMSLPCRM